MKDILLNFASQLKDASITHQQLEVPQITSLSNIVICGMGGSAISGDLLAGYLQDEINVPIIVNRGYELPHFVDKNSLIFISSYSGNTEETLSAYNEAIRRTKNIICITSGGKLEALNPRYIFRIPQGYQPRCAIGWLFVPMIIALNKLDIIENKKAELEETISLISAMSNEFGLNKSTPYKLAEKLVGKLPIIYSDTRFISVAKRWVAQINENSKQFAHYNVLPELNHNEIVGFGEPKIDTLLVILRDKSYHPRVSLRIELTKQLLISYTDIQEIESKGTSLLTRFFYLIYFGDWVSYWVAKIKNIDPTPVERINWLKEELSK
ncbi:MAG: bifunctional phosphoglucose/phosphomannose isomerase [Candidatus Stahlbacteria bacterium]|nr:bifunctional phosphoglucose/phosphomannose isomerase [Candidatus Stahlbacteria bacterium]